jgi:type IX secretion system PorP/SprF family membrane protein
MTKKSFANIKTGLIFCCLLLSAALSRAQQPFSYTQYMNNLTPLNPAYSLINNDGSVNSLVRKQWVGIDGAPTTFIFNGNIPFSSIGGSAGLIIMDDSYAIENQTQINAFFAKSVQLGENQYLGAALNFGVRRYVANYSSLASNDPLFTNDIRETKANAGFGILYYTDVYYLGVSVPQLTFRSLGNGSIEENNFFRNHYYISAGFIAPLSDGIKIKPATLVAYSRGVPVVADISTTFIFKNQFGIGINYRTNDEMAGIILFNINEFEIGYSYQFGTSAVNLGGYTNATHEVTLGYHFSRKNSRTADSERQLGL